ncbi:DUF3857 domain-containing protein [bacterium]|nr:DUF3857 domain-containing protein [bacterium]
MKRALLLALLAAACLAAALPARAASEGALDFTIAVDPAALLAAAPAPQPGEDGLVVYEAHLYRYADGLMRHRHQRLLRVATEWALERLADPRLRFDSARQKITVHAARTYFPGGAFVDSPANAFNTVTPGELALAPDFLDIQELVITHIGLEPGCALWLDTEIVDTAPAGLPEGALLFPQGEFPVLEMHIDSGELIAELISPHFGLLTLPEGDYLLAREYAEKMQAAKTPQERIAVEAGYQNRESGPQRRWHFENLPAAPGQATHRLGDQLPHLVLSPRDSWKAVMERVDASLNTAAVDSVGLGAWLARVERDLERPFLSDRDALAAMLAALDGRTSLLSGADWAWHPPRSVARILETSVATPLERTAVMIAACRSRGWEPRLLLANRWERHSKQLLALAAIDAPQLRLPEIGRFSPAEGRIFESQDQVFYTYTLEEPSMWIGLYDRSPFVAESSLFWDLRDGEFAMDLRLAPQGRWAGQHMPESALRDWCASWSDSSRVESLDLQAGLQKIRANLSGTAKAPAADETGRIRLALPTLPVELAALLPPGMQRGQSECRALLFPHPMRLSLRWVLDLPTGMQAAEVPPINASCSIGSLSVTRKQDGEHLILDYDLDWATGGTIKAAFIEPIELPVGAAAPSSDAYPDPVAVTPDDYPAFRALVNAALDPKTTEVLLVPRAKASP